LVGITPWSLTLNLKSIALIGPELGIKTISYEKLASARNEWKYYRLKKGNIYFAESDSVNNSYQWASPLTIFNDMTISKVSRYRNVHFSSAFKSGPRSLILLNHPKSKLNFLLLGEQVGVVHPSTFHLLLIYEGVSPLINLFGSSYPSPNDLTVLGVASASGDMLDRIKTAALWSA